MMNLLLAWFSMAAVWVPLFMQHFLHFWSCPDRLLGTDCGEELREQCDRFEVYVYFSSFQHGFFMMHDRAASWTEPKVKQGQPVSQPFHTWMHHFPAQHLPAYCTLLLYICISLNQNQRQKVNIVKHLHVHEKMICSIQLQKDECGKTMAKMRCLFSQSEAVSDYCVGFCLICLAYHYSSSFVWYFVFCFIFSTFFKKKCCT